MKYRVLLRNSLWLYHFENTSRLLGQEHAPDFVGTTSDVGSHYIVDDIEHLFCGCACWNKDVVPFKVYS